MKKDYIYIAGILIIGIIISFYLFKLPKQVVNEKNRQLTAETAKTDEKQANISDSNHMKLSKEQEKEIKKLRTMFITFSEKEKKRIFASSLAELYFKVAYMDSALVYVRALENLSSNLEEKQEVANLYYTASKIEQRVKQRREYSEKAVTLYKSIIVGNPNLEAKTKLGVLLTRAGQNPMEGIMLLREVLEENPNYVEALYSLGEFSMMTKQYEKAINRFEAIIAIEPDNLESLIFLGDSYIAIGNKKAGVEAYRKALQHTDGDKFFQQLLEQKLKEVN